MAGRRFQRVFYRTEVDWLKVFDIHLCIAETLVVQIYVGAKILVIPCLQSFETDPVDFSSGFKRGQNSNAIDISSNFITGIGVFEVLRADRLDIHIRRLIGVLPETKAFDRIRWRVRRKSRIHRFFGDMAQSQSRH